MKNDQTLTPIAGCVIVQEGKYLLVQEKLPKAYGKWNLPAGHVDPGETNAEAAVREVREETGLIVTAGEEIFSEALPERGHEFHIFSAQITGGELYAQPDEILDVQWFSLADIHQLQKNRELRSDWMVTAIEQSISK